MDWIKTVFFILLINLSFSSTLFGQSNEELTTNDFWTGISFKHKLNKKIAFNLDNQVRITNNLNEIRSTFFEFGVPMAF